MSQGQPVPLEQARPIAHDLVGLLRDSCTRIEIAGSIRRRKPMVADIEIVAMPRIEEEPGGDLWGTPITVNHLSFALDFFRIGGQVELRNVEIHRRDGSVEEGHRDGDAYKALMFRRLPVDLFIVHDPDTWGTIFALRTGPGDWNTRIVTDCQRYLRRVAGGQVYRSGQRVPCPEEADFFRAVGQPWVEPHERTLTRVSIQAQVP